MKLSPAVPALVVLSAVAVVASVSTARAFESVTSDQFPSTFATKLADPDDIIQDMSQRYAGNSATILHSGNTTIGIVGTGGGYGGYDGPFLADPAMDTVPSKRQW